MSSAKKYQVFISSTYTDLLDERQAAVEAILQAGHIPAGMELFTSSNQSQWDIIKRWIDESDIYMLILGGRYGSIETKSGKSYTHLEYEYALSIKKPLFVMVIKDEALSQKTVAQVENQNPEKLKKFKKKVLSSMCEFFIDTKDIQLNVHKCLGKIIQDNDLIGWVRGNQQNEGLVTELVRLNEENRKLKLENEEFRRNQNSRMPKLTLELNPYQEEVRLKFKDYESLYYKKRDSIDFDNIPISLKEFINEEDINKYNNELKIITDENISKFNEIMKIIGNIENNIKSFNFIISNEGNLKAKQVYISITFPPFIYIEDKDNLKDKANFIKNLDEQASEIIKNYLWNPLIDAQKKLAKKQLGAATMDFYDRFNNPNKYLDTQFINTAILPKSLNLSKNKDYIDENRIVVKIDDLMHPLCRNYNNYSICPLSKGKGSIVIDLYCEEYLDGDVIEIPIIVE